MPGKGFLSTSTMAQNFAGYTTLRWKSWYLKIYSVCFQKLWILSFLLRNKLALLFLYIWLLFFHSKLSAYFLFTAYLMFLLQCDMANLFCGLAYLVFCVFLFYISMYLFNFGIFYSWWRSCLWLQNWFLFLHQLILIKFTFLVCASPVDLFYFHSHGFHLEIY